MNEKRFAEILRLLADMIDPQAVEKAEKGKKSNPKPALAEIDDSMDAADGSGETNAYRIMFAEFGTDDFDLNAATKLFKKGDWALVLYELGRLEVAGLAQPRNQYRNKWRLEKSR